MRSLLCFALLFAAATATLADVAIDYSTVYLSFGCNPELTGLDSCVPKHKIASGSCVPFTMFNDAALPPNLSSYPYSSWQSRTFLYVKCKPSVLGTGNTLFATAEVIGLYNERCDNSAHDETRASMMDSSRTIRDKRQVKQGYVSAFYIQASPLVRVGYYGMETQYQTDLVYSCTDWTAFSAPPPSPPPSPSSSKLSTGFIVAVSVGGAAGVCLLAALVWYLLFRKPSPAVAPTSAVVVEDIELPKVVSPLAAASVLVIGPICPNDPAGHQYRRKWTVCSYICCLLGCCMCAMYQRKRVCKNCGHRSD